MQKIRWILLLLTIVLASALVWQNHTLVPVSLLWMEHRIPLSVLAACTTAAGFLAGSLMTASMLRSRSKGKPKKQKSKPVAEKAPSTPLQ